MQIFPFDDYMLRKTCVVCGHSLQQAKVLSFDEDQAILTCTECSVGNTRYYPTEAFLPSLYESTKVSNSKNLESRDFDFETSSFIERAKDYFARYDARKLKISITNKSPLWIADFGAGNGRYSVALKDIFRQAKITAIDFQEDPPGRIETISDIEYVVVEEFNLSKNKYDIIFLRHVLEHSLDPLDLLLRLKTKLNDGGIISVEVPNCKSRISVLTGTKWVGHYLPRHITHYDQIAIKNLANMAGYSVKIKKKNPPIIGNQICAYKRNAQMSPLLQIVGGLLFPIQLILELGKSRGAAINAEFQKNEG